jgi:hypothetical protein
VKLVRAIIRDIINGKSYSMKELGFENQKIKSIYTIIDEDKLYQQFDTQTGERVTVDLEHANLVHWKNVFVEDRMHDWDQYGDKFKFYAHSKAPGNKHDLVVVFE